MTGAPTVYHPYPRTPRLGYTISGTPYPPASVWTVLSQSGLTVTRVNGPLLLLQLSLVGGDGPITSGDGEQESSSVLVLIFNLKSSVCSITTCLS